jgi:hypothetical protein
MAAELTYPPGIDPPRELVKLPSGGAWEPGFSRKRAVSQGAVRTDPSARGG